MVIINKSEQKSKRAKEVAEHKVEKGIIKIRAIKNMISDKQQHRQLLN